MTMLLSLVSLTRPLLSAAWTLLQKPAVLIGLAFAVLMGSLWLEDHGRTTALARQKAADAALATAKASAALNARQAAVSQSAEQADTAAQTRILTVYKTLSTEIPFALPASVDAQCVVPSGVVRLLDAGVSDLPLPGAVGGADAAAPTVDAHLSDLVSNALANDAAKAANDQQLRDLQAWILAQQAVTP